MAFFNNKRAFYRPFCHLEKLPQCPALKPAVTKCSMNVKGRAHLEIDSPTCRFKWIMITGLAFSLCKAFEDLEVLERHEGEFSYLDELFL